MDEKKKGTGYFSPSEEEKGDRLLFSLGARKRKKKGTGYFSPSARSLAQFSVAHEAEKWPFPFSIRR
jgi:hypothetical protein